MSPDWRDAVVRRHSIERQVRRDERPFAKQELGPVELRILALIWLLALWASAIAVVAVPVVMIARRVLG